MASLSVPVHDQIEAIYGLEGEAATRIDVRRSLLVHLLTAVACDAQGLLKQRTVTSNSLQLSRRPMETSHQHMPGHQVCLTPSSALFHEHSACAASSQLIHSGACNMLSLLLCAV